MEMKERYDLNRVGEHLTRSFSAQERGDLASAIVDLRLSVASLLDYIRAKERGDV